MGIQRSALGGVADTADHVRVAGDAFGSADRIGSRGGGGQIGHRADIVAVERGQARRQDQDAAGRAVGVATVGGQAIGILPGHAGWQAAEVATVPVDLGAAPHVAKCFGVHLRQRITPGTALLATGTRVGQVAIAPLVLTIEDAVGVAVVPVAAPVPLINAEVGDRVDDALGTTGQRAAELARGQVDLIACGTERGAIAGDLADVATQDAAVARTGIRATDQAKAQAPAFAIGLQHASRLVAIGGAIVVLAAVAFAQCGIGRAADFRTHGVVNC
ncbi:hypothetical protein D3C81_680380 [compost metagenome]